MTEIRYRSLHRYKYQLTATYVYQTEITGYHIETEFIGLTSLGILTIKKYYSWDGPSGPTIDTKSFMRGSLVHDAIYQLIRMELLPISCKKAADRLLRKLCREDNMCWPRAWWVYQGVKWFGANSCIPGSQHPKWSK